ncbi:hypothetical protein B0H34DRAFT_673557 [Crassisporium funariophilum]|nr:hypothetical protein B0H34DRAFT_673557 [Crassisporium funariophilum]
MSELGDVLREGMPWPNWVPLNTFTRPYHTAHVNHRCSSRFTPSPFIELGLQSFVDTLASLPLERLYMDMEALIAYLKRMHHNIDVFLGNTFLSNLTHLSDISTTASFWDDWAWLKLLPRLKRNPGMLEYRIVRLILFTPDDNLFWHVGHLCLAVTTHPYLTGRGSAVPVVELTSGERTRSIETLCREICGSIYHQGLSRSLLGFETHPSPRCCEAKNEFLSGYIEEHDDCEYLLVL